MFGGVVFQADQVVTGMQMAIFGDIVLIDFIERHSSSLRHEVEMSQAGIGAEECAHGFGLHSGLLTHFFAKFP